MLIPIGDENPTARQPIVNWTFIGLNALIFLASMGPELYPSDWAMEHLTLRPDRLEPWTFITSMFLHGGLMHLIGNMLFLWIVGDNVEDVFGRAWYVPFYLGCGVAADLAHLAIHHGSDVPTLGASGAVAGVLGAYVVLFPNHQIKIFYFLTWWWFGTFYITAKWAIGIWIGQQVLFSALSERPGMGGTAFMAHIGGFVAGAAVAFVMRDKLRERAASGEPVRTLAEKLRYGGDRPATGLSPHAPVPDGIDERGQAVYGVRPAPKAPLEAEWRAGPAGTWAVLATADEALDPTVVGPVVAQVSGRQLSDVTRELRELRGFLARGVDEGAARATVQALARIGVGSVARDEGELRELPPPVEVPRGLFHATGFECDTAQGYLRVEYDEVILVAVGRVRRAAPRRRRGSRAYSSASARHGGTSADLYPAHEAADYAEVLTVFLRAGPRLLLVEGDSVVKLERKGWGVSVGMPIRAIVVRLLNHAPRSDRNRGVEILTGGARRRDWSGLTFEGFGAYEAYTAWLWQIRGQ